MVSLLDFNRNPEPSSIDSRSAMDMRWDNRADPELEGTVLWSKRLVAYVAKRKLPGRTSPDLLFFDKVICIST
jgi:hypothetical protein